MLDNSVIRAIAAWRGDVVTSLYLDVDGRRSPRSPDVDRRADHLLRIARRRAPLDGGAPGPLVEAELGRIARWLDGGVDRSSTRGVALFAEGASGRFEALALPVPVRDQVVVDRAPDVAQLCEVLVTLPTALVVAVDRRRWRLLRWVAEKGEELDVLDDDTPRWVDTDVELGGFDRHHEELEREHYRGVATGVIEELGQRSTPHVVLTGPAASTARLEGLLPDWVLARLTDRLVLPVDSSVADLAQSAQEAVARAELRRRAAVVGRLRERAASGAGVVTGLGPTLGALGDAAVATLVVEATFEAPGGRCGECALLTTALGPCPRCGAALDPVPNVVDAAITQAFLHGADLEPVEDGQLADLRHIGALARRWAGPAEAGGQGA